MQAEGRQQVLYGAINLCSMPATPQPHAGYQGAWLGRLENFRTSDDVRRVVKQKLRKVRIELGAKASAFGAPVPFATGDLHVMDGSLAHSLFGRCVYLRSFVETGRSANRRSNCKVNGTDFASSWATLTCDWCVPCEPPCCAG